MHVCISSRIDLEDLKNQYHQNDHIFHRSGLICLLRLSLLDILLLHLYSRIYLPNHFLDKLSNEDIGVFQYI